MKTRNLSDWAVALAVIACSVILFAALAFALSGRVFGASVRTVQVNFQDVTGIKNSSQVKLAGAVAGVVTEVRVLTQEERAASKDPKNAVRMTIALNKDVPPLSSDAQVSVASDTLLSDKFVLISPGSPSAPLLAEGQVLQGIAPTSFDKLVRDIDRTLQQLETVLGGNQDGVDNIIAQVQAVLKKTDALISDIGPVVIEAKQITGDARTLVSDANLLVGDSRSLIGETRGPLKDTILKLDTTVGSLNKLADKGTSLLASNEKNISSAIADFKVTSQNLKVSSTYAKILLNNLYGRPNRLLWGGKAPPLPSEREIIESQKPLD